MARSKPSSSHALAIVLAILLVVSQLPARWIAPVSRPFGRLLDLAYSPLTAFLTHASSRVTRHPDLPVARDAIEHLDDVLLENRRLRQERDELRRRLAEFEGLRQRFGGQFAARNLLSASITGYSGQRSDPQLVINRGTLHGISKDDVVISSSYLVGRIAEAGPSTSRVRLINAPDTLLEVSIAPLTMGPPPRQTIAAIRSIGRTGRFEVIVPYDRPVRVQDAATLHLGDLRVTRGIWPEHARGLIVGVVVEVEPHEPNPTMEQRVIIRPVIDLTRLTRVVVITEERLDGPPPPAPPPEVPPEGGGP